VTRVRLLILLGLNLLLFLCVGCASGPVYQDYASTIESPAPGRGRVYIYRPSALPLADVVGVVVHVNDAVLEHWPRPRTFVVLDQPEGEVRIRIYSGEVSFPLQSGETRYVKIRASHGLGATSLYLELVGPEQGRTEIEGLRLVGEETEPAAGSP